MIHIVVNKRDKILSTTYLYTILFIYNKFYYVRLTKKLEIRYIKYIIYIKCSAF